MDLIELLKMAVAAKASDLHLIAGIPPMLRVDGEIVMTSLPPLSADQTAAIILEKIPPPKRRKLEEELQLCYSLSVPDVGYFRVTIYYEQGTLGACVRVGMTEIKSLAELGLPPVVAELTRRPNGLILITGPTGSGKTTTLNSMIDLVNSERRCKIVTVEDPIEYVHRNKRSIVVQQELYTDAHSFQKALIHVLRQDPNVIAVGEMRDLETISTALTAAETGHLVISTLHTPDAPQTVERIIDVFPPAQQTQVRLQLASSLEAVISQVLLPRVDRPGRVLAAEIMIANTAVRNIIREGRTEMLYNVIQTGQQSAMQSMDSCLRNLYQQGIITYDVAATHARFPESLRSSGGEGNRNG